MTAFTDLLAEFESEKHFLAVLEPYSIAAAGVVTLYYSTHGFISEPGDTPSNQEYESRLKSAIEIQRSLFKQGKLSGRSIPSYGALVLNNLGGGLDAIAAHSWNGRRVRIYLGGKGFALADYGLIFDGTAAGIEYGQNEIRIPLRDLAHKLDKEIQTTLFLGTGGVEGGTDVLSRKKPRPYGPCRNVSPVFVGVSSGRHQYVVADGSIVGVLRVCDGGVALTYTTSATPAAGEWTVDVSNGLITLGATPAGVVTCDVIGRRYLSTTSTTSWTVAVASKAFVVVSATGFAVGMKVRVARTSALASTWGDGLITAIAGTTVTVNVATISGAAGPFTDWTMMAWGTVAGIVKAIATDLGVSTFGASVAAMDTTQPATYGHYIAEGGNGLAVLDVIADGAGCYYGFDRAGSFDVGRIAVPAASAATYDETQIISIERVATDDPNYRVVVSYRRAYTVHSLDQILAAATDADRLFMANEWRMSAVADAAVLTAYPLSQPIEVQSGFDESTDAAAEATRLLALFKVKRDYFEATLKVQPLSRELSQTVTVEHDRYGLDAGADAVIVDQNEDMTAYRVELGLWK